MQGENFGTKREREILIIVVFLYIGKQRLKNAKVLKHKFKSED